jgi:hypothetical protein
MNKTLIFSDNRVYISPNIYLKLCPKAVELRQAWLDALAAHADPGVIYKAMQAYFIHRNGTLTKNFTKKETAFCRDCTTWIQEHRS